MRRWRKLLRMGIGDRDADIEWADPETPPEGWQIYLDKLTSL